MLIKQKTRSVLAYNDMPLTLEQFAQNVKKKYPQYKDVPDLELADKMLVKYPQYKKLIGRGENEAADTFLRGHPVLRGISNLMGTTGLAKGLTQTIFFNFTKEGKDVLRLLREGKITESDVNDIVGGVSTPKEVLGSSLQVATTAVAPGVAKAKSALGAFGTLASLSGSAAFGRGIESEKMVAEAAKGAIAPALIGGVIGVGFHYAGKLVSQLTKKSPEVLYQSALKQSTQDFKKELVGRAPNLSRQLIKEGVRGSENKILSNSLTAVNEIERKITKEVAKNAGKAIETKTIANSLNEITRQYENVLGPDGITAIEQVKKTILAKGAKLPLKDALTFKRDIYKTLSNSSFNVDASLSQKSDALRIVANSVMNEIGKADPVVAGLTKNQQMWIRTAQAIEGQLSRTQRANIIGLSDSVLAAGGGANPSFLLVGVGRRLFETTSVKTTLAVGLDRVGQLIERLPVDSAGKISKTALINLLKEANQ